MAFLEWFAEHWLIGFVLLCFALAFLGQILDFIVNFVGAVRTPREIAHIFQDPDDPFVPPSDN